MNIHSSNAPEDAQPAVRAMTETELREIAAQEAAQNATHDAAVHARANEVHATTTTTGEIYHDAAHPAVTGTGVGDNRDETSDPEIAAGLGGVGGAIVGAAAGAMLGPIGAVAGAVVGGLTGFGASGLAVDAVDQVDTDTNLSGLGPADGNSTNNTDTQTPIV